MLESPASHLQNSTPNNKLDKTLIINGYQQNKKFIGYNISDILVAVLYSYKMNYFNCSVFNNK